MGDMNLQHRIVTWNCNGRAAIWDYLLDLHADVALLQEVGPIPERVRQVYDLRLATPKTKTGRPQRFKTALLVRGTIGEPLSMPAPIDWVAKELDYFSGNLPAYSIELADGTALRTICVYSPAWPVDRLRLEGLDLSGVKLSQNPDVWVMDLLWASLNCQRFDPLVNWVIAGDFNSSETFDQWPGGPRGNREYLDKMASLGLVECLRQQKGRVTPTFRDPKGHGINHQTDHLFVTSQMAALLVRCETGSPEQVFGLLSDHLPIVADFAV